MNGAVMNDDDGIRLTEAQAKRRRQRNVAIAAVLIGMVVLFYFVTLVKMGANVFGRAL
jgi:hypothetical protein